MTTLPATIRVLVVDDEMDVRDGIRRVLERAGYSFRTANSVTEALSSLDDEPAEVIVTDIIMPTTNGVVAIGQFFSACRGVRLVAISGGGNFDVGGGQPGAMTTDNYLTAAADAGAHVILTKPFETVELIDAIQRAMRNDNSR